MRLKTMSLRCDTKARMGVENSGDRDGAVCIVLKGGYNNAKTSDLGGSGSEAG